MPSIRRSLSTLPLVVLFACEGGDLPPEVPWVTAPTYESHDPYFPIDSGKHEGIDCDKCHGAFETFTQFTCIDCHVHSAEETDPAHTAVPGYTYAETSCFDCHPRGEVDGAGPEHELIFPIASPSAHQDVPCSQCHVDSSDREVVTCVDCHAHEATPTQAAHTSVGGYRYETSDCLKCHYDSGVPRVAEHVPFRIDAEASHAPGEAACLECHTSEQPGRPFPSADFGRFDCGACHLEPDMDDAHRGLAGYVFDSPTCITCHIEGEEAVSREAHDAIFLVSTGKHETTECSSCHATAGNTEDVTCAGCHPHTQADTDAAHGGVGGYRFASADCLECHADRPLYRLSQHQPFRIDGRSKHRPERADCMECHPSKDPSRQFVTAAFEIFDCLGCHEQGETDRHHREERGYRYDSPTCVMSGCHPTGEEGDD